ncbi:cell division protein FtsQ/DivIB [Eisenibacter elegans]|uniref:cell division protein FtsQ/DivIB n=1 Tax=Eisenibacter elegans TaxID=997 RepID=UPI00041D09C7|nr:hypothetical protein [Eisenibacter elegans]
MKQLFPKLRKEIRVSILIVSCLLLWGFVETRHQSKTCQKLVISFAQDTQLDNYFLDEEDIKRLMSEDGRHTIIGEAHQKLSVKALEERIRTNAYVAGCQVSRNVKGDLFVQITQKRPIARFVRDEKPDFYIDSLASLMPVVRKYTSRVLTVTREDSQELPNFELETADKQLLHLLRALYAEPFFRAQIAHIHVDKYKQAYLYPQIGKQTVEFGSLFDIDNKLKKLKVFYDEILPLKGWNAYKRINLKYDHQIICE